MDHERFAPLLYRIVLAGVTLGVMAFIQTVIARGPATSPLLMAAVGLIPPFLVAVFFVQIVCSCALDRRRLSLGIGAVILVVAVLQLILLVASTASEAPRTVTAMTPQLTQFAYMLLIAVVVAAYIGHRLNKTYGLLAALFFLTAPPVLGPCQVGLLVLDLVFYWTSALLCLFLWGETDKTRWLVVGGLCMGLAAGGVAWYAALLSLVLGLGILGYLIHHAHREDSTMVYLALFVLCGVIPLATWNAVSYAFFGDVSAGGLLAHRATDAPSPWSALPQDTGVMGFLKFLPQSILLVSPDEGLLTPTLILGPASVCFLPWAFKGKWGYEKRILLAVVVTVLALVTCTGELKTLGFLPIIPLLVVLAIFGIHNLYMNIRRPVLLFTGIAVVLGWNFVTAWKYFI